MAEPPNIESSTQEVERKRSLGDAPATTMAVDLAVFQAHAQWWSPDLKPKMEASQSSAVEGADGVISAWVAEERNHISGQELIQKEGEMNADLIGASKLRALEAWGEFDVYSPHEACEVQKQVAQTRWVLT